MHFNIRSLLANYDAFYSLLYNFISQPSHSNAGGSYIRNDHEFHFRDDFVLQIQTLNVYQLFNTK